MYFVSTYGFKAVAAFGLGYRVEQIILLPMLGLNTAVISIVSNNFGAKNFDRIDEVIHKSLKYGYIMSAIGIALIVFFVYLFLCSCKYFWLIYYIFICKYVYNYHKYRNLYEGIYEETIRIGSFWRLKVKIEADNRELIEKKCKMAF